MSSDRLPFADALAELLLEYNDQSWDDLAAALEAEAAMHRGGAAAAREGGQEPPELPHYPRGG